MLNKFLYISAIDAVARMIIIISTYIHHKILGFNVSSIPLVKVRQAFARLLLLKVLVKLAGSYDERTHKSSIKYGGKAEFKEIWNFSGTVLTEQNSCAIHILELGSVANYSRSNSSLFL